MTYGEGEVTGDRCFGCHNQLEKVGKIGEVELIHISHIAVRKVECERCHGEIQHAFNTQIAEHQQEICKSCHERLHNSQRNLYMGMGGRGIKGTPDPMYLVGISCTGCHTVPKQEEETVTLTGQTYTSGSLPCISCHGDKYRKFPEVFIPGLSEMQAFIEKRLGSTEDLLKSEPNTKANGELPRAYGLIKDAKFNYDFVKNARGIHNPFYAVDLLKVSNEFLNEAEKLLVEKEPELIPPAGFSKNNCMALCHSAFPELKLINIDGEKKFPHDFHVVKSGAECTDCHHGEHPPKASTDLESCSSCHHKEENLEGGDEACKSCHNLQASLISGSLKLPIKVEGTPSTMEIIGCTGCHDLPSKKPTTVEAVRGNCIACHGDEGFGGILDEWVEGYGKRIANLLLDVKSLKQELRIPEQEKELKSVEGVEETLKILKKAKPVHNIAFSDEITGAIKERIRGE